MVKGLSIIFYDGRKMQNANRMFMRGSSTSILQILFLDGTMLPIRACAYNALTHERRLDVLFCLDMLVSVRLGRKRWDGTQWMDGCAASFLGAKRRLCFWKEKKFLSFLQHGAEARAYCACIRVLVVGAVCELLVLRKRSARPDTLDERQPLC